MPCANNSVNTSVATGDQEVQFSTNYQSHQCTNLVLLL